MTRLSSVYEVISQENFLCNRGLSNEVGIHIFCYDPKDEIAVTAAFDKLKNIEDAPYRLLEQDLYEIFLDICSENGIMDILPDMEKKRGSEFIKTQLDGIATPQAFCEKMVSRPLKSGRDILLITGVGKVYPYMRAHTILNTIQNYVDDIPILLLYPGVYDGRQLKLFGKFPAENYYRAFNMI